MAAELLGAVVYPYRKVEYKVHHDLESFAWVLAYVLARYINTQKDLPTERRRRLKKPFTKSFGLHDVCDIHTSRLSCKPLDANVYGDLLPKPMATLLIGLREAVYVHSFHLDLEEAKLLTHDMLLRLFSAAHQSL